MWRLSLEVEIEVRVIGTAMNRSDTGMRKTKKEEFKTTKRPIQEFESAFLFEGILNHLTKSFIDVGI